MARFKDQNWNLPKRPDGGIESWEAVHVAVLMDIRDELKKLNAVFECPNFIGMPSTMKEVSARLRTISRKIPVRQPRKKA